MFPPDKPGILNFGLVSDGGQRLRPVELFIDIINDGETKAFNVKATGNMTITPTREDIVHEAGDDLKIPKVIRDADIENPVRIAIMPSGLGSFIMVPESMIENIQNEGEFLRMTGCISYDDVFGKSQSTPFDYLWENYGNDNGGEWRDDSYWIDLSSAST